MASTRIYRTLGQNSNSGKLTISVWVKRSSLGEQGICGSWSTGALHGILYFSGADNLVFYDYRNSYIFRKVTNAKFRDVGAWYHIVCNFDHTLSSPTGKIYVNGVEQSLSTDTNYSQGATSSWLTDYTLNIGTYNGSGYYLDGSMSDFYFIQGYVYEASTFGETDSTTGEWKPITNPTINYSGTGGNSCHLKFENSANMDLDSGDNNVTFTTSGTLTQTEDNPSNNFATFSPLIYYGGTKPTFSNGNTSIRANANTNYGEAVSTLAMPKSGKFYAEFKRYQNDSTFAIGVGDMPVIIDALRTNTDIFVTSFSGYCSVKQSGAIIRTGQELASYFSSSIANGDIIGIAMDLDNGAFYAHKNGTYGAVSGVTGDPTSGSSKTGAIDLSADSWWTSAEDICFFFGSTSSGGWDGVDANFGNGRFGTTAITSEGTNASNIGKFEYDVPTGYTALSTKGLNE